MMVNTMFDVKKGTTKTFTTERSSDSIIISIDHIDINPQNHGRITFHYVDGVNMDILFHGNGGLIFFSRVGGGQPNTKQLCQGFWNLKEKLQLNKSITAFCSSTYMKNTWTFCSHGLTSIEFFTDSIWSGMNSVRIASSTTTPLYLRPIPITSMKESSEKIILYTKDGQEALYFADRIKNFKTNQDLPCISEGVHIISKKYHGTNNIVFECKNSNITTVMTQICGSKSFFSDESNLICCKSWYDILLLNQFLGVRLEMEVPKEIYLI